MKFKAINTIKGVKVQRQKTRGYKGDTFEDSVARPGEVFECTGEDEDEISAAEERLQNLGVAVEFDGKDSEVTAKANAEAEMTEKNRARLQIKQAEAEAARQEARDAAKDSDRGVGTASKSDNDSDKKSDAKKKVDAGNKGKANSDMDI